MPLSSQEVANLAYAYAILGCGTPALYQHLAACMASSRRRNDGGGGGRSPAAEKPPSSGFNRQDVANLAHAFAVGHVGLGPCVWWWWGGESMRGTLMGGCGSSTA